MLIASRRAWRAGIVLCLGGSLVGTVSPSRSVDAQDVDAPNVVFVMTDDMRPGDMAAVADLKPGGGFDWVRDNGVQFTTYASTDNLCCPGRTTALTGRTAFNHLVFSNFDRNTPPAKLKKKSLPLWMQKEGYCTGFTGKYHIYNPKKRPAGWTFWEPAFGVTSKEYGYKLMRRNGKIRTPQVFLTDRLAKVSRAQIKDCLDRGQPFFTALWPVAPHFGSDPEPDYEQVPVPWSNDDPSFDEADISDKPAWLQAWYPQEHADAEAHFSTLHATRVRSLLSVDDALASILDVLDARGELGNTLVVLTSDNGWLMGEHRVDGHKRLAYEAGQPGLWIAGPGFPAGVTSDAFATNLDLTPTIVKASGRPIPPVIDGRALQDVLSEDDRGHDRFLPLYVPIEVAQEQNPVGEGVRTARFKYVQYADGSKELYDLVTDPFEEHNLASAGGPVSELESAMQELAATAKSCRGTSCRASAPPALQG